MRANQFIKEGGQRPGQEQSAVPMKPDFKPTPMSGDELSQRMNDLGNQARENPLKKPYKPNRPTNLPPGVTVKEAVDESWVQAYKALDANGGEPTPDKPTLFVKQMAMMAKDMFGDQVSGKSYEIRGVISQYLPDATPNDKMRVAQVLNAVMAAVKQAPSIDEIRLYAQQQQAQQTQFQQQQAIGELQHDLTMQQLIRQNDLDKADAEAMLAMDFEARQAIRERSQELAIEAQERLARLEIEIRNSQEPEAERQHALQMAQMNHAHEVEVIKLTAEGEYKKAKLEADYQIKIKELENIDNAEERQSKLDVINANKVKELSIIDAETRAKIQGLRAETNAEREQSDIRVQEAFMMTFKPIWASIIERASQLGRTVGQSISAVTGALNRLSKPTMPQAQRPQGESIERIVKLAGR